MFVVDMKGEQTVHPVGAAFVGLGIKTLIVMEYEVDKMGRERWEEYLNSTLKTKLIPEGRILKISKDGFSYLAEGTAIHF